jgi:hypothetical protein
VRKKGKKQRKKKEMEIVIDDEVEEEENDEKETMNVDEEGDVMEFEVKVNPKQAHAITPKGGEIVGITAKGNKLTIKLKPENHGSPSGGWKVAGLQVMILLLCLAGIGRAMDPPMIPAHGVNGFYRLLHNPTGHEFDGMERDGQVGAGQGTRQGVQQQQITQEVEAGGQEQQQNGYIGFMGVASEGNAEGGQENS